MSLPPQSSLKRSLSAALAGLLFASPPAALPPRGQVVSGKAAISQVNPGTIQIQQFTANVVINWKGFSVGANELVRFLQPGATSVAVKNAISGAPPRPHRA